VRGFIYFVVFLAVAIVFCGIVPFVVMPGAGIAPALPIIYVPGEPLETFDFLPFTVTNTILTTWLVMLITFIWVIPITQGLKAVPGRAQAFVEMLSEYWYDLARSVAGPKGRQLVPLMLSIFFFLLVANLIKVVPGMDTVGEIHCAGLTTYHAHDDSTEEKEKEMDSFVGFNGYHRQEVPGGASALKVDEALDAGDTFASLPLGEDITPYMQYKGCTERLHPHDEDHSEEEDHSEDAEDHEEGSDEAEGEGALILTGFGDDNTSGGIVAAETDYAAITDPANDRYVVTPFFRGPSTDLALTFAIALIAMIAVQFFGIKELGVAGYGSKFFNFPALGRGGLGIIDFAVGLLETVLEVMKIVSFAFRLFGAMFGGMVLFFVITFLVGLLVPLIVYGLEVFVGGIQAFVFTILFLMFSSVAMTSHAHDDEHDDHH
jgi:F-type H+-transporting ATPase subunit a